MQSTTKRTTSKNEAFILGFLRENENKAYSALEIMKEAPNLELNTAREAVLILEALENKKEVVLANCEKTLRRWKIKPLT